VNGADLRTASEKVSMMHQNTKDRLENVTDGDKKFTINDFDKNRGQWLTSEIH